MGSARQAATSASAGSARRGRRRRGALPGVELLHASEPGAQVRVIRDGKMCAGPGERERRRQREVRGTSLDLVRPSSCRRDARRAPARTWRTAPLRARPRPDRPALAVQLRLDEVLLHPRMVVTGVMWTAHQKSQRCTSARPRGSVGSTVWPRRLLGQVLGMMARDSQSTKPSSSSTGTWLLGLRSEVDPGAARPWSGRRRCARAAPRDEWPRAGTRREFPDNGK